ncbi:protein GRIP isoform X1 [Rhodamnia argentea]|uniref:Protein GRIP n=1 Tax=Rhodamnia argentea TaxID=178133 RepID=A0A8B8PMI6_9MYRT|nr:protein GRIP isoform X1 [Rhodamnia argentea]XP_048140074.1 protein GRIP isoform X1 [Rhodamnia argentea]
MSAEGGEVAEMQESNIEDSLEMRSHMNDASLRSNGFPAKENGSCESTPHYGDTHDELVQMVTELKLQNEYLKSHFEGLKDLHFEEIRSQQRTKVGGQEGEDVKRLNERIESLEKELLEEKQTRGAADEALKHLQVAHSEADARAQELSARLAEAQQKMDQEIKEREEKYSELDSKFSRLHKRAKQRIQEVQKEKDDLEARFREVNEIAEQASSQQLALQQEVDRTRQQANEAMKAIDAERQQLRSACNKLRDDNEELRQSMQPKDLALGSMQQSLLEKEQMLEDLRNLLKSAEEKRQASLSELTAKHQKNIENLESQLADAASDRSKATEMISSLQVLLAEKESKIAELDAASTGEAARLRATMESVKGEVAHLKREHDKEKESWEAACQALKTKLEVAEGNCICAEVEVAKLKSQLEIEASTHAQLLNARDAELAALKEENHRLQSEFSSYKARAHTLLQKKDAELASAKDSEEVKALEEALKETEKEALQASAERDKAIQDLQAALANRVKELEERDAALNAAKQQMKTLEMNLDSVNAQHQKDKEAWELDLKNLEETWRNRCEALKAENEADSGKDIKQELDELKSRYKRLKEEHDSFRDLADKMIEEKDNEISRLLDDTKNLQRSLELRPPVEQNDNYTAALQKQEILNSASSAAEQQILFLARQQAQREEELAQSQRHILALQEEIEELERENRLHSQQEAILKEEFRNMERMQKREGVDMTYLKNVILKLLETGEVEALLPVVAMLLQFSPEEMQKCQAAYRAATDVPPTPPNDTSGSPLSLLSRFSFS